MEVSLKIAAFFYISLYCTCLHMTVASVEFCVPSPRAHVITSLILARTDEYKGYTF